MSSFRWIPILALATVTLAQQKTETILFTHAPEGEPPWPVEDIYAMDANGANVRALTRDGHSHDGTWSPNGQHVLYVHDAALDKPMHNERSEFASHHPIELYVMNRNGSGSQFLWKSEFAIFSAAWSPDGKVLAISTATQVPANASDDEPMRSGLFLLSADGHSAPRLLIRDALTPTWSPDGKQLAFSKERPRGQWAIHVALADGSNDRQLTEPPLTAGSPAWSPRRRVDRVRRIRGPTAPTGFRYAAGRFGPPPDYEGLELVMRTSVVVERRPTVGLRVSLCRDPLWGGLFGGDASAGVHEAALLDIGIRLECQARSTHRT